MRLASARVERLFLLNRPRKLSKTVNGKVENRTNKESKIKKNRRFDQLQNQTQRGVFGDDAVNDSLKYQALSGDSIEISLKAINDFYSKEIHQIFRPYPLALIEIILRLFFKYMTKN